MDITSLNNAMHKGGELPALLVKRHTESCAALADKMSRTHGIEHAKAYLLAGNVRDEIVAAYRAEAVKLLDARGARWDERVFAQAIADAADTIDHLVGETIERSILANKNATRRATEEHAGIRRTDDMHRTKTEYLEPVTSVSERAKGYPAKKAKR
jgi:hypothetical protein